MTGALFPLGRIGQTQTVEDWEAENPTLRSLLLVEAVGQHGLANWSAADDELRHLNELAVETGEGQVHSIHHLDGQEIWVITDFARGQTAVIFPEDY